MFDRTFLFPTEERTNYVTKTVIEKRAPTDESVALLKDMEAAARAKLLESVKVSDTKFECVVHTLRDFASGDVIRKAVFSLNGEKLEAESRTNEMDVSKGRKEAFEDLRDEIAQVIATKILASALRGLI